MKAIKYIFVLVFLTGFSLANEKFKDDVPERKSSSSSSSGSYQYSYSIDPTHYFFIPTSRVLDNREFILSFHEWSLGIDRGLHVFISPLSTVGDLFMGGKYRLSPTSSVGLGIAGGWYYRSRYWIL